MSPVPRRDFDPSVPSSLFREEWANPSNYAFTVLLLLGGDVVGRALAQLAGGKITPVAFSFGKCLSMDGGRSSTLSKPHLILRQLPKKHCFGVLFISIITKRPLYELQRTR